MRASQPASLFEIFLWLQLLIDSHEAPGAGVSEGNRDPRAPDFRAPPYIILRPSTKYHVCSTTRSKYLAWHACCPLDAVQWEVLLLL